MDSLLLVIIVIVVLLVLFYFLRKPSEPEPRPKPPDQHTNNPEPQTFEFFPPPKDSLDKPLAKRHVVLVVPPQNIQGGEQHQVKITALDLPPDPDTPPPPEKGIDWPIRLVIHPEVRDAVTDDLLSAFDPPLDLSIDFDSSDAEYGEGGNGIMPHLSIITFYQDGTEWRWEKLDTKIESSEPYDSGTLKAQLKTLKPGDPIGMDH